jgi:hypothetical protein
MHCYPYKQIVISKTDLAVTALKPQQRLDNLSADSTMTACMQTRTLFGMKFCDIQSTVSLFYRHSKRQMKQQLVRLFATNVRTTASFFLLVHVITRWCVITGHIQGNKYESSWHWFWKRSSRKRSKEKEANRSNT